MPVVTPAGSPSPLQLGVITPNDAIDAFTRRNLLQPSYRWQDVWADEHARSFAVAGVQRLDVLEIFRSTIEAKLTTPGATMGDYLAAVRGQLQAAGWWGDIEITDPATGETRIGRFNDARMRLIYDVNMRQSYAAGRWARIERNQARMPFVIYKTMNDERVRASHRPWHNLVLPVGHPFWRTHYPPCGWRCRCTAYAIDEEGIKRLQAAGQNLKFDPPEGWDAATPYVNPRTGEVAMVYPGIDPGWAYNPGMLRDAAQYETALRKALQAEPLAGAVALAQATAADQQMLSQATQRFSQWVDSVVARGTPLGEVQYLGSMPAGAVRALQARNLAPQNSVIAITDADVLAQRSGNNVLPLGLYQRLPTLLQAVGAVYVDNSGALLYVVDIVGADGVPVQLVLTLQQLGKLSTEASSSGVQLNVVRAVRLADAAMLAEAQNVWQKNG